MCTGFYPHTECFWQQDCHTLPKKEQEQQSVNALADIDNQHGIQMALPAICDTEKIVTFTKEKNKWMSENN